MNSKQECIAKEYLDELSKNLVKKEDGINFYENLKPFIDENGWIDSEKDNGYSGYLMESDLEINFPLLRLKSLQGIENNNGWVKIESEADLPKKSGWYDFQVYPQRAYKPNTTYWHKGATKIGWYVETYTHYQPITKPEPPLH